MTTLPMKPGRDWLDIITRPTLAAFSAAFSIDPELTASVLHASLFGASHIRAFFMATRAMYDRIVFTRETGIDGLSFLEWEGSYRASPIAGVTILDRDAAGAIARIRLFHSPYGQLVAFADDLAARLASNPTPTGD